MKHSGKGHALALGAMFLAVVATSVMWIMYLRAGPPLDGWTGGAMVVFVPFLLLIFAAGWIVVRLVAGKFLALSTLNVAWVSALASYLVVAVMCGPLACFANSNSTRRAGLFLVGGAVLIALAHHFVLSRFPKQASQPFPTQS